MSNSRLKTGLPFAPFFFGATVILTVITYLWRCQFSVDLTDEAFYLLPAWKLFSLGDHPFRDEIFNGLRHSDLLNYLFIKPFLNFSVLSLRRAAVLVYATILLLFTLLCFRRRLGLAAALCFSTLLTFDYFLMPTWSYNWWCRDALLLHHSLLLLSERLRSRYLTLLCWFASGIALGIIVIAYNTLIPLIPLAFATLLFYPSGRKHFPFYAAGCLLAVGIDLGYLLSPTVKPHWLNAIHSMTSMGEYSSQAGQNKLVVLLKHLAFNWDLWILLTVGIFLQTPTLLGRKQKLDKFPRLKSFFAVLPGLLILPSIFFLLLRAVDAQEVTVALNILVALGVFGVASLLQSCFKKQGALPAVIMVTSGAASLGMALCSTNGYFAIYWGLPGLIIPAIAHWTRDFHGQMQRKQAAELVPRFLAKSLVTGFLGVALFGTIHYQRTRSYYDVPPGNCLTELRVAPLKGLKTSKRRAELIDRLLTVISEETFLLVFSDFPGAFYLGRTRPSVDTTIVERDAPADLQIRSLKGLLEKNRIPRLGIWTKVHPWYWGIEHPLSRINLSYEFNDPYLLFSQCVKGEVLADRTEFEIFTIQKDKIADCLFRLTLPTERLAG